MRPKRSTTPQGLTIKGDKARYTPLFFRCAHACFLGPNAFASVGAAGALVSDMPWPVSALHMVRTWVVRSAMSRRCKLAGWRQQSRLFFLALCRQQRALLPNFLCHAACAHNRCSKEDLDAALAAAYSSRDAAAQQETRDKAARARGEVAEAQKEVRNCVVMCAMCCVEPCCVCSRQAGGCAEGGGWWIFCAALWLDGLLTLCSVHGLAWRVWQCALQVSWQQCRREHARCTQCTAPSLCPCPSHTRRLQVEAAKSDRERKAAQRKADQAQQRVAKYEQRLQEAASHQVGAGAEVRRGLSLLRGRGIGAGRSQRGLNSLRAAQFES